MSSSTPFISKEDPPHDASLLQYETFDDLLSQCAGIDSQNVSTPTLCRTLEPSNLSFQRLLNCLSRDILSPPLTSCGEASHAVHPPLYQLRNDDAAQEELYTGMHGATSDGFAPLFRTAGRNAPVRPQKASIHLARQLLNVDNSPQKKEPHDHVSPNTPCSPFPEDGCEKQNPVDHGVVDSDLHRPHDRRRALPEKADDRLSVKQQRIKRSSDHQVHPRNKRHVHNQPLGQYMLLGDALCQSPSWTYLFSNQDESDNTIKPHPCPALDHSVTSPMQNNTSGVSICFKQRPMANPCHVSRPFQRHEGDETVKYSGLSVEIPTTIDNVSPVRFPQQTSTARDNISLAASPPLSLPFCSGSPPQSLSPYPSHVFSIPNFKTLALQVSTSFSTQNRETTEPLCCGSAPKALSCRADIVKALTEFNLVGFLCEHESRVHVTHVNARTSNCDLENWLSQINFLFSEGNFLTMVEAIGSYFRKSLTATIQIQSILCSIFHLYSSLQCSSKKLNPPQLCMNILRRVWKDMTHGVLFIQEPDTTTSTKWRYPSALESMAASVATTGERAVRLSRPLQVMIVHYWTSTCEWTRGSNTSLLRLLLNPVHGQKNQTRTPSTARMRPILHWFVITDGKKMGLLGVHHINPRLLVFGCLVRLLSYEVMLVTASPAKTPLSLYSTLFSCIVTCAFPNLYIDKSPGKCLPQLGFLPKIPSFSVSHFIGKCTPETIIGLVHGVVIRKFPVYLCVKLMDPQTHDEKRYKIPVSLEPTRSAHLSSLLHRASAYSFQTSLLIMDALCLKTLSSLLSEEYGDEHDHVTGPYAEKHPFIEDIAKLCLYLRITNISVEDYLNLVCGQGVYVTNVKVKCNTAQKESGGSNTSSFVAGVVESTSSTQLYFGVQKGKLKQLLSDMRVWMTNKSVEGRKSDIFSNDNMRVAQVLFPVIGHPPLMGLPISSFDASHSTRQEYPCTEAFGLFASWHYDVGGVVLRSDRCHSTGEIYAYILTHSGLVKVLIHGTDDYDEQLLKSLEKSIEVVTKTKKCPVLRHVQFQHVDKIQGWGLFYKKDGIPDVRQFQENGKMPKPYMVCTMFVFHGVAHKVEVDSLDAVCDKHSVCVPRPSRSSVTRTPRRDWGVVYRMTMAKWKVFCDRYANHNVKNGLVDLEMRSSGTLNKLQQLVEFDTKHVNLQLTQNEDHILGGQFRCVEAEINALQVVVVYRGENHEIEKPVQTKHHNVTLAPSSCQNTLEGISSLASNGVTLWSSLEMKYATLLKSLVTETLEDSMCMATCNLWNEELVDWEAFVMDFERFLDTQTWDDAGIIKPSPSSPYRENVAHATKDAGHAEGQSEKKGYLNVLSSDHRLLINILTRPTRLALRSEDEVMELLKLSCSVLPVPPEVAESCMEIWEILITMCGKYIKTCVGDDTNDNVNMLRQVVHNVVRSLQDICRKQILRQLHGSSKVVSDMEFLEQIKVFCTLQDSADVRRDTFYYLKVIYWSYRSGCLNALLRIAQALSSSAMEGSILSRHDSQILVSLATLLYHHLKNNSLSPEAEEDLVWTSTRRPHTVVSGFEPESTVTLTGFMDLLQRRDDLVSHPIVTLLTSFLQPDASFVALKTIMPNATAEDFLWYNLSLVEDKPASRLVKSISTLQKRIIALGPAYFGSTGTPSRINLAFAKVTFLALAPTVAIDWTSQAYPELTVICLQWLFYLAQCGFVGSKHAHGFLRTLFPDLHKFLGTVSFSSGFEELLLPNGQLCVMGLQPALQWCELLPRCLRGTVIASVIHAGTPELLKNADLRAWVLGTVEANGSCSAGFLYRCLLSPGSMESVNHCVEDVVTHESVLTAFETLVAGIAEAASQHNRLLEALELSYLISQDRAAMKFLLNLFTSPSVFPHLPPSDKAEQDTAAQAGAFMFFRIFKDRICNGELQELMSTFEHVVYAKAAAECYTLSYEGNWKKCWEHLTRSITPLCSSQHNKSPLGRYSAVTLFPDSRLVLLWNSTDLAPHLCRLLDVAARCIEMLPVDDKQRRCRVLLKTYQDLHDLSLPLSSFTHQRLRRILDHSEH